MICLPDVLITIARALPCPLYVVGGAVRDGLMGVHTDDIDLAAPLAAEALVEAIRRADLAGECQARLRERGIGTVDIALRGGSAEYTAFRTDVYEAGFHRPSAIRFTEDIRLDAQRRDFTVNALYYDIAAGKVVDPLGRGQADLAARVLDTTREPLLVLGEDGLRLLRLCRFAAQLGFAVHPAVVDAARQKASLLFDISPAQASKEIGRLYETKNPQQGMALLENIGVLRAVFGELPVDIAAQTLGGALKNAPQKEAEALFIRWSMPRALRARVMKEWEDAQ